MKSIPDQIFDEMLRSVGVPCYQISGHDAAEVEAILLGKGDWFGAHLLRLIKKADVDHRRRISLIYPSHVEAVERFEQTPLRPRAEDL